MHSFKNITITRAFCVLAMFIGMGVTTARGVILVTNDFNTSVEGWDGSGDASFSFLYANGRLEGTFAASELTSDLGFYFSSSFTDVAQGGTYSLTAILFDFFVATIVPSSLTITLSDPTFTTSVTRAITGLILNNNSVNIPIINSTGWSGDTGFFDMILTDFVVDITVARSGGDLQSYYLDNFQISGDEVIDPGPGPDPGSAVPEPTTITLLVMAVGVGLVMRRRIALKPAG